MESTVITSDCAPSDTVAEGLDQSISASASRRASDWRRGPASQRRRHHGKHRGGGGQKAHLDDDFVGDGAHVQVLGVVGCGPQARVSRCCASAMRLGRQARARTLLDGLDGAAGLVVSLGKPAPRTQRQRAEPQSRAPVSRASTTGRTAAASPRRGCTRSPAGCRARASARTHSGSRAGWSG